MTRVTMELSDDVAAAALMFFADDPRELSLLVNQYLRWSLRRWKIIDPRPRGRKKKA